MCVIACHCFSLFRQFIMVYHICFVVWDSISSQNQCMTRNLCNKMPHVVAKLSWVETVVWCVQFCCYRSCFSICTMVLSNPFFMVNNNDHHHHHNNNNNNNKNNKNEQRHRTTMELELHGFFSSSIRPPFLGGSGARARRSRCHREGPGVISG